MDLCCVRGTCVGCDFSDDAGLVCFLAQRAPERWKLPSSSRWAPDDIAMAKAVKAIWPEAETIHRGPGHLAVMDHSFRCLCYLPHKYAHILQPGKSISLEEIISGGTYDDSL